MGCANSIAAMAEIGTLQVSMPGKVAETLITDGVSDKKGVERAVEREALKQLSVIFESIDVDDDGKVSNDDIQNALRRDSRLPSLVREAGLNQRFRVPEQMDANADGHVTWREFEQSLKTGAMKQVLQGAEVGTFDKASHELAIRGLRRIFEGVDSNGDGVVTKREMAAIMEKDERVARLLDRIFVLMQMDASQDACITWDEFQAQLIAAATAEVKRHGVIDAMLVFDDCIAI